MKKKSLHVMLMLLPAGFLSVLFAAEGPFFASGIKIGEGDQTSVMVWTRLTEQPKADFQRLPIFTEGLTTREKDDQPMPLDVVAGANGEVRVRYWPKGQGMTGERRTAWAAVLSNTDFTCPFKITELQPGTAYELAVEARGAGGAEVKASMSGGFKTAPSQDVPAPVHFVVTTCQAVRSIDSGAEGHVVYKQMLDVDPDFMVHTGDILYYDKAPLCKNQAQARAKWNLMFAYGHNQYFHRNVTSYFMKDDHDTLKNDCWPGQTYGELTFAQGLAIFREQVPMGEKTYRTIRWGRDVQIWMTENRDYRSANSLPDGPGKTILGMEQMAWLKKTMSESDATYKFLISPGPIVGPDKKGKADNHANRAFAHEGRELRNFLNRQKNTFVICGDRHWQYCSKDPETGLLEMGCGPINDQHNFGGDPGENPAYHRFFGKKGGFLSITVANGAAKAEWYSANGGNENTGTPKVNYTETLGPL